ncbi:hypothetical protein HPB52_003131 [Rhipicephalus sanguineus]|uniref:Uncharacterized protein n=1 Tax=Rhipicephalus sanguineus TaxID=34632 RepID=A0A9D4PQL6_RHISA|nr:hypothetical protein HPB52_003131 [Rhipicephalus sanguineus]
MVCSVHFVDGRPTEDNPYPTLRLGTLDVPYKGRRRVTHTAPSQLWPGAPSTGSSPQHHVADEPNDDYSAAFADDDMNDSLPAKNQLGPGIVTYERAFRPSIGVELAYHNPQPGGGGCGSVRIGLGGSSATTGKPLTGDYHIG